MGCVHDYDIDSRNVGTCKRCGQVTQFSFDGKSPPVVLKEGNMGNTEKINTFHTLVSKPQENITNNITKNPQSEANKTESTSKSAEKSVTKPAEKLTNSLTKVPPKPKARQYRGAYYEAHRQEIEADVVKLGLKATLLKWDIKRGVFDRLKRKWSLKFRKYNHKSENEPKASSSEHTFTRSPYSELASEVCYLKGWKECSIAFIEALKR